MQVRHQSTTPVQQLSTYQNKHVYLQYHHDNPRTHPATTSTCTEPPIQRLTPYHHLTPPTYYQTPNTTNTTTTTTTTNTHHQHITHTTLFITSKATKHNTIKHIITHVLYISHHTVLSNFLHFLIFHQPYHTPIGYHDSIPSPIQSNPFPHHAMQYFRV